MLLIALVRLVPVLTSVWIFLVAAAYTALPEAPRDGVERLDQRHARREHRRSVRVQRAIVAFCDDGADDGKLEQQPVECRCGTPSSAGSSMQNADEPPTTIRNIEPPPGDDEVGDRHDDQRGRRAGRRRSS